MTAVLQHKPNWKCYNMHYSGYDSIAKYGSRSTTPHTAHYMIHFWNKTECEFDQYIVVTHQQALEYLLLFIVMVTVKASKSSFFLDLI